MKIFNMSKKKGSFGFPSCLAMAKAIVEKIPKDSDAINKVELAQVGKGDPEKCGYFLNIYLQDKFIQKLIMDIVKDGVNYEAETK